MSDTQQDSPTNDGDETLAEVINMDDYEMVDEEDDTIDTEIYNLLAVISSQLTDLQEKVDGMSAFTDELKKAMEEMQGAGFAGMFMKLLNRQ